MNDKRCISERESLHNAKRIVVKIGTSSLVYPNGSVNLQRITVLAKVLSDLMNRGKEVILVSSGAIGVGVGVLKLPAKPDSISGRQAVAAVGQSSLMQIYNNVFSEFGYTTAQILMTKDVVDRDESRTNVINTFTELLKLRVIPIVNENDSVAVHEIKFGDNDSLSGIVAELVEANLLIILTDIDGYYRENPREVVDAEMYHNILDLSEQIELAAGGAGSKLGTGGMLTKVHASRLAAKKGIDAIIANGTDPNIIYDIMDGKDVGTLFIKADQQN